MALDALVTNQPYKLLHGLYFFLYTILYLAWSGVFHAAKLETSCTCDQSNVQFGCLNVSNVDNADKCLFIYSSLNWYYRFSGQSLLTSPFFLC